MTGTAGAGADTPFAGPLVADSDVARDMHDVDWASTPLGPPAAWPQALRDYVRMLLTSRFSMWMSWGPEQTMFYNDAYRRDTLRGKHPWALGRPASEVWAEVWEQVTPQVRAVLDRGESTWDEDLQLYVVRNGWPEESFHTFSYSPLADADAQVRGLLCVVTETTGQVLAQRRISFLRDLAAAVSSARSVPDVAASLRGVLERDGRDVPFGLLYLVDEDTGDRAHLAAAVGTRAGGAAAPAVVPLDGTGVWSLDAAAVGVTVVDVPVAGPDEDTVPANCDRVALVPLTPPAGTGGGLFGVLVVGLSRYLAFDERYRDFVDLLGGQVAAGLLDARAAESERRRAEALAELDAARVRFFADASHELRTPLTLIAGPVDGLLAEMSTDPGADAARWRGELEVVARNTQRLTRLVGDLLEVSRLQAGGAEPRRVAVDLAELTTEVAAMVASAMQRGGLDYVVTAPDEAVPVAIARDAWERVLLNLVANALKYTRAGHVEVRLRREGRRAVLTVTDTGVGIAADELPRLFDRFHRVEGGWARSAEGSGIGLALVHELVARHDGQVGVESEPGVGTTFTVSLPLAPDLDLPELPPLGPAHDTHGIAEEASRWVPAAPAPAVVPEPDDPSGRVLVVDDNADMRAYITRLLAPRCVVTTASNGDAALESATNDPPDMVVSDVMMPGRSGLELLAALRADPRTARVPVLLLSARAGEEAAVEGLAAQADDYLVKPFAPGELQARVQAHLQLGRARREAEARFTAVADLAPAMIWVADEQGRRVFLNAGWSRFTGRDPASELGNGWTEGLHPDDRREYEVLRERGHRLGRGWEAEFRLRHVDGTYHRCVEQCVPVPSADGHPSGWVGSAVDVHVRLRDADRARLFAEVGAAMDASTTVQGRLRELVRVLRDARLADQVTVQDTRAAGAAAEGPHRLRRPLTVRDRTLAVLVMERDPASAPWSDDDRALVDEVVARTVPALDNALLYAEERTAAQRLGLVHRATAAFSAAATPFEVARVAAANVEQLLGDDAEIAVYEYDGAARSLSVLGRGSIGLSPRSSGDLLEVRTDSIVTRAVRDERSIWVHEPEPGEAPDAQPADLVALLRERGLTKAVALPLLVAGRVVGALGVGFSSRGRLDEGERTTLQALVEPCAVALDRARLYRAEHEIAQTLQRSLLPQALPEVERLPVAVRYLPGAVGTSAGGDWYDVVEVDETHIAVVVGDVVGQGTAAAAVMGQLRTALSGYLLAGHGPGPALDLLDGLVSRVPGARASTAICLLVDTVGGEVRWARAGHLPALFVDAKDPGRPILLTDPAGHGPLLGLSPVNRRPRTESTITIDPGSNVVLYTDGLVERRGESLDEGLDRLVEVAAACDGAAPEPMASTLLAELAPAEAIDDVAVVVVRLVPAPLRQRFPADPVQLGVLRRAVRTWAGAAGVDEDVLEDLQLALGEAATNAVEHAYGDVPDEGSEVTTTLAARADGGVSVEVGDTGTWRTVPADPGHRGRGLTMIRALASDVVVDRAAAGTSVSFTVPPARRGSVRVHEAEQDAGPEGSEVTVDIVEGADGPAVTVRGDLDLAGAAEAGRRLVGVRAPRWTLDVTGVGHLASAGVGLLLDSVDRGAVLRLPDSGPAARVLRLSGVVADSPLSGPPGS